VALKELPEKGGVLITDGIADFLHGAMIAFEQAFGGGDAKFLEVGQGAVTGGLFETANEIAQAHADVASERIERKVSMEVLVHPLLRVADGVIGVLGFEGNNGKAGLPGARSFDEQGLGTLQGDFVTAVTLHQKEAEI